MGRFISMILAVALLLLAAGACRRYDDVIEETKPGSRYDKFEFLYYTGEDDKYHVYQWWEGDATGLYVYDESKGHTTILPFCT